MLLRKYVTISSNRIHGITVKTVLIFTIFWISYYDNNSTAVHVDEIFQLELSICACGVLLNQNLICYTIQPQKRQRPFWILL